MGRKAKTGCDLLTKDEAAEFDRFYEKSRRARLDANLAKQRAEEADALFCDHEAELWEALCARGVTIRLGLLGDHLVIRATASSLWVCSLYGFRSGEVGRLSRRIWASGWKEVGKPDTGKSASSEDGDRARDEWLRRNP